MKHKVHKEVKFTQIVTKKQNCVNRKNKNNLVREFNETPKDITDNLGVSSE